MTAGDHAVEAVAHDELPVREIAEELYITLSTVNEGADRAWIEALTDNYLKMAIWGRHQSNRWFRTVVEGLEGGELIASVRP